MISFWVVQELRWCQRPRFLLVCRGVAHDAARRRHSSPRAIMPPRRKRARTEEAEDADAAQEQEQQHQAAVDAGAAAAERREAMAEIARRRGPRALPSPRHRRASPRAQSPRRAAPISSPIAVLSGAPRTLPTSKPRSSRTRTPCRSGPTRCDALSCRGVRRWRSLPALAGGAARAAPRAPRACLRQAAPGSTLAAAHRRPPA
jgi:hypothetical protein